MSSDQPIEIQGNAESIEGFHGLETDTFFAPAGRQDPQELKKLSNFTIEEPIVDIVLKSVGTFVLILNSRRQILAVNQELLDALHRDKQSHLTGQRFGEAFGCASVPGGPDGCGTSPSCRYCGAVIALLNAQKRQEPCNEECMMTVLEDSKPVASEFAVRAVPLRIRDEWLTVMVFRDISSDKRRNALERVFLHDFNNILTGLVGLSELAISRPDAATLEQLIGIVRLLSREMSGQRLLVEAEQGELSVHLEEVLVSAIIGEIEDLFSVRMLHMGRPIVVEMRSPDAMLQTDKRLVTRVLTNMVKNAIEATSRGNTVRLLFDVESGTPNFAVWNKEAIDDKTADQVFKRSFSTKGDLGRGLGTYSMKLLGEYYLKGTVRFDSSEEAGTTFFFSLPSDALIDTY